MKRFFGIFFIFLFLFNFYTDPIYAAALVGDLNNDYSVNIIDIGIVIDSYGKSPIPNPEADLNKDGVVNILDIGIIIDNFGNKLIPTPTPTISDNSFIWWADADSVGMSAWKTVQCPSGACDIVNDPQGRFGKVYRTTLNTGETYSGDGKSRAELYGAKLTNDNVLNFYQDDDYYLGWRSLVSNGIYTNSGNSGNFIQLKGDSNCGGPAIGLTMENGLLTLRTELYGIFWNGPRVSSFTGSWHDIVLHVYFSKNSSQGFVEAWFDGVQQTFVNGSKHYNIQTMCPDDNYIYLKMGYYRGSHPEYPSATHWFESPRVGKSYDSVVPR